MEAHYMHVPLARWTVALLSSEVRVGSSLQSSSMDTPGSMPYRARPCLKLDASLFLVMMFQSCGKHTSLTQFIVNRGEQTHRMDKIAQLEGVHATPGKVMEP